MFFKKKTAEEMISNQIGLLQSSFSSADLFDIDKIKSIEVLISRIIRNLKRAKNRIEHTKTEKTIEGLSEILNIFQTIPKEQLLHHQINDKNVLDAGRILQIERILQQVQTEFLGIGKMGRNSNATVPVTLNFGPNSEIAVLGDLHIAESWDKIAENLKGTEYLNANEELRNFIKYVNKDPSIAVVVQTGDIVDYHFRDYMPLFTKNGHQRETNWDLYHDIISELRVPIFENIGNHDYRREPYNYSIYGLNHVNVSAKERKSRLNVHNSFRALGELNSITPKEGMDMLKYYRGIKIPSQRMIGPYQCVFLNTGGDAFVRLNTFFPFLKSVILGMYSSVVLYGLTEENMNVLRGVTRKPGKEMTLIFMHAPMIYSRQVRVGKEYQLSADNFLTNIALNRIANDVFIKNLEQFFKELISTQRNVVIVASHTHKGRYFLINKKTLKAKEVTLEEFNRELHNPEIIKQMTTLPLGVMDEGERRTGFAKITPSGVKEIVIHDFR